MNFPETISGAGGWGGVNDTTSSCWNQGNISFCDRRFDSCNNPSSSSFSNRQTGSFDANSSSQNYVANLTPSGISSIPGRTLRATVYQSDDVAEALQAMSFEQREEVYDDIHGTGRYEEDESPAMVSNCLKEIDARLQDQLEIDNSRSTRSALQIAIEQNPAYVKDPSFQMRFLRAFEWNPKKAVDRIVKFLEKKRDLFGTAKLTKDITIHDLDDDDMACLAHGGIQAVPLRDRAGRRIVVAVPSLWIYRRVQNMVRAAI